VTTLSQHSMPPKFKASGATEWRSLQSDESSDEIGQSQSRDSKAALKDMLLASLQMQNIVVLVGSGASISAGGPSMKDLWNAAIGDKPSTGAQATATKINFDLSSSNIEAFLSRSEAYLQVKEDDSEVQIFVNSCKSEILKICSGFLKTQNLVAHKTFLHRLARRRVRDTRLKIFTTNYDLCFEHAASELGGVPLDGFSFSAPRHYDPRYFGYDIIRRPRSGDDQGNYLEGVFHLYKLHGSVNWARSQNGIITEKTNPTPEEACLIYPASGKYQQSFLQPHLESMSQYLAVLREPNTCVLVAGFGFNDNHLSEPLLAAVRSNPHLRLIIADPSAFKRSSESDSANHYWKEFFDLSVSGEDIWFVNASFPDFVHFIPDLKSLTPADKLMKALQGIARDK